MSPVGVIWILLLRRLTEPLADMLHLHAQWSYRAVQLEALDRLRNLRLLRDGIIDREGGDFHWDGLAQRRDVAVERHPLCHNPLDGYPGWGGRGSRLRLYTTPESGSTPI